MRDFTIRCLGLWGLFVINTPVWAEPSTDHTAVNFIHAATLAGILFLCGAGILRGYRKDSSKLLRLLVIWCAVGVLLYLVAVPLLALLAILISGRTM